MLEVEGSLVILVQSPYFVNEEMELQGCVCLLGVVKVEGTSTGAIYQLSGH